MSALLLSDEDLPDIAGSIARADPIGASGPGFFDGALGSILSGIQQGVSAFPLAWAAAEARAARERPDTAGMDPLRLLEDAQDEGVSTREIIDRRKRELDQNYARAVDKYNSFNPDPLTVGFAGQTLHGLFSMLTEGVAGTIAGGPVGGAAAITATQFEPSRLDKINQGVDERTADTAAAQESALYGLQALAPVAVPGRIAMRIATGAGINAGLGAFTRGNTARVLRENGYGNAADRYDPLDAQSLVIDAAFGGIFGAWHGSGAPHAPEVLDAAMVTQDAQRRDTRSPFGVPVNNEADRRIAAANELAASQIEAGEPVDVARVFENVPQPIDRSADITAINKDIEPILDQLKELRGDDNYRAYYSKNGVDLEGQIESLQTTLDQLGPDDIGAHEYATAQREMQLASRLSDLVKTRESLQLETNVSRTPDFAPIDPYADERDANMRALEEVFNDPEVRAALGDIGDLGEDPFADWKASRTGNYKDRPGAHSDTALRDYIIDRATGMSSKDIAAYYDTDLNNVAASISQFKRRVMQRLDRGDTLDTVAHEMRVTVDVLQKAFEDQPRKTEARDVVLRLAMKGLDNGQIAERMRGMGFEKTTKDSVKVMRSNLKKAGHEFPKAEKKSDFLPSRREAPIVATPKAELNAALAKSFGKSTDRLLSTGKVEVLDSVADLNAATGREFPADTKAVHGNGKTYVVAQNVSPQEARGIVLHEVGVHHGLEQMLGAEKFALLKTQIDAMLAAGHPAVMEARALAEAFALKPEHVAEETMAYLVEHHPDMPFVRRMLAQIRQWLWRAFPDLVDLTPDDIAQMAVASLRRVAREDRGGFSDWMTSFGGALATREGRARWAETNLKKTDSGFNQTNGRHVITYAFDVGGKKVDVGFVKMLGANDETYWDVDFDFRRKEGETAYAKEQGGFGGNPTEQFGFVSEHKADALAFTANNESLARLYSRMAISLRDENTRVWEQTNPENGKVRFILADKSYDPKAEFPRAKPLEKPLSAADMAARTDAAKNDAVARYLDWFRESGGMDNAGNYIDNMRASRKKSDGEMNDPVKAAIAEDPTLRVPNENGDMVPAQDALDKADEGVKQARELAKGFEAAGACAARQARGLVSAGEQRMAELTGGLALGGAVSGAIATAAVPALTNRNEQERQAELDARIQADQLAIAEDRARFVKENPVTSIPVGRDMGNTVMHAADRTGVPEQFLRQLVGKESAGDPNAKASTSSATGATQFLDATWSRELLRVGPKLGFEGDPYSQEALDLRKDPRWAVMVAAEFAKANAMDMKQALGRDPTHGEVYLAHFMGVSKAIDLINAAKDNEPNASALFPKEAKANQNVFHGTARDVLKRQTKNFSDEPFVVNQ